MNFIDKLEILLLRPRAKVYYNYYSDKRAFFSLGCDRRNYGQQDKEIKKNGIISMMQKLRDNNNIDPDYNEFSLDLIGWNYFNDILALEPTNEDLFNLYKITGYARYNKLDTFLEVIEDKDWKLKFFKYGRNYTNDYEKEHLKGLIKHLPVLTDDEWIDALSDYFNNSIKMNESKESLVEICIECIKDNHKCEQFVKKFFNEDINLSFLFIENKVNQLKIDSKSIIKNFGYSDSEQVDFSFNTLYQLLKNNLKEIGGTNQIDFYSNGSEYNFITYDDNDNMGIETIKWLIYEMMPVLKTSDVTNFTNKTLKDLHITFNDDFLKRIFYFNLSIKNDKKDKKDKLVKI